jgi:hypothetical protein
MKEIKCPKCGSETTVMFKSLWTCNDETCSYGIQWHTMKIFYDEIKQKQRLERVLSKFVGTLNNEPYYEIIDKVIVFDIAYIKQKFYLVNTTKKVEYTTEISLDTVESLIKDLERNE